MQSLEKSYARRSRIFMHLLIISGTLNFALIATFITFVLKEQKQIALPPLPQEKITYQVLLNNKEVKGLIKNHE